MKLFYSFFVILITVVSCDIGSGADNGRLHIYNDTNSYIRVYYKYEEESSDSLGDNNSAEVLYDVAVFRIGEDRVLEIQSNAFFSGEIDVVYGGIQKHYDINFDIFDHGVKHVDEQHFYDLVE